MKANRKKFETYFAFHLEKGKCYRVDLNMGKAGFYYHNESHKNVHKDFKKSLIMLAYIMIKPVSVSFLNGVYLEKYFIDRCSLPLRRYYEKNEKIIRLTHPNNLEVLSYNDTNEAGTMELK